MALSEDHRNYFANNGLSEEIRAGLEDLAKKSLAQQRDIEATDEVSFDDFLAAYFADYYST